MVSVSLYIGNQKLDLFDDENISLTQSIQNVRDISKVFANFTQTFTVPASKANNSVFKHYYNYSIINGFDARKKIDAKIELNYLPFQTGKVQLVGANLKNGAVYSYKIIFFGNIVELKDVLGEDDLSALTWLSNFKRPYSANNVLADLQSDGVDVTVDSVTYTDALVMPFITNTTQPFYANIGTIPPYFDADGEIDPLGANLYPSGNNGLYYEELKYGIRVWLIVKAIEETYGITFHPDSFLKKTDNPQYYDLYMWMHREKGFAFKADTVTNVYNLFPSDSSSMTRVFSSPSVLTVFSLTGSQTVSYALNVTTAPANEFTVGLYKNGLLVQQQTFPGTTTGVVLSGAMTNGNYSVYVVGTPSNSIALQWQVTDNALFQSATFTGTTLSLSASDEFNAQLQVPKMRIIDFLTALFKMFNLTAYKTSDGSIMVETLDDYYAGGQLRRIDEYIDITDSQVDSALPYKEVVFEYTGRNTKLAQLFEQEQNTGWGTEEYKVDNDFIGGQYRVEVPFEHMQFERLSGIDVQVGYMLDDNDQPYIGAPLLFYRELITGGTAISFLTSATTPTTITSYCIPMNSVSTSTAISNKVIHFFPEINEYTPTESFTGTLFQEYYNNYINDVFDNRRRLFKYKAILPVGFLYNYSLKDTLQIFDTPYIINQITTNLTTGESTLELLNVLDSTYDIVPTTTIQPTTTIAPTTTVLPTTTTTVLPTTSTTVLPTTSTTIAPTTTVEPTTSTTLAPTTSTTIAPTTSTTIQPTTTVASTTTTVIPTTTVVPTTTVLTIYYRFERCSDSLLVFAELPSEPNINDRYIDASDNRYIYIGPPTTQPGTIVSLNGPTGTGCIDPTTTIIVPTTTLPPSTTTVIPTTTIQPTTTIIPTTTVQPTSTTIIPTTTAAPQTVKAKVQLCGGSTVWYVEFVNISSTFIGASIKGNGTDTLGTSCWEVLDNDWQLSVDFQSTTSDVYSSCSGCEGIVATTTLPTTTTTLPWNSISAGYNAIFASNACNAVTSGSGPFSTVYWLGAGVPFGSATVLYSLPDSYSQVPSGFYSDGTDWLFVDAGQGPPGSPVVQSGSCGTAPTTTVQPTTTIQPTTTTVLPTTTSAIDCTSYQAINEGSTSVTFGYNDCVGGGFRTFSLNPGDSRTVCARTGTFAYDSGDTNYTIINLGAC